MHQNFIEQTKRALSLKLPYEDQVHRDLPPMGLIHPIPSAVLLLLGWRSNHEGPELLYIQRSEDARDVHRGQMAFPGGRINAEEMGNPNQAALRETFEEVGLASEMITLLGQLPALVTATGFSVTPVVGFLSSFLTEVKLTLDRSEIEHTVWIPIEQLGAPETYRLETFRVKEVDYPIHVYQILQYRIWGATGSMTKNFLDRLKTLR